VRRYYHPVVAARLKELVADRKRLGDDGFRAAHGYPVLLRRDRLDVDESAEFHTSFMRREAIGGGAGDPKRSLAPGTIYPITKREGGAFADRIGVGRARNADVSIQLPKISKYHAYFTWDDEGRWFLSDAGSKNGTRVDGDELEARTPVELRDTAEVTLGPYVFHYYSADALAHLVAAG